MGLRIIDIASYQAGLNPHNVDADGIIVKVSQGAYYTNPTWRDQAQATLDAGKVLGLYHFVDTNSGVDAEVNYFLDRAGEFVGRAVLVLDWEHNSETGTDENNTGYAKEWLDKVYDRTGVRPMIYMSHGRTHNSDWSLLGGNYGLWSAQYGDYNVMGWTEDFWEDGSGYGAFPFVAMNQYTSTGRIGGYDGNLDLNIFWGDRNTWQVYANSSNPTPVPQPSAPSGDSPQGSVQDLAKRVLRGEFGDSDDRVRNLGSRYNEVQDYINGIYGASTQDLVNRVYAGEFGDGDDRKLLLGGRYDEVQGAINGPSISAQEIADQIWYGTGDWGTGEDRRRNIEATGNSFDAVQAILNVK